MHTWDCVIRSLRRVTDNAFEQESAFFAAESLTVVQWGYLSDRYGRRPILLIAPLGLGCAMFAFGMSMSFWPLVVARCFQGIFNGNIGVSKSILAEVYC